MRNNVVLSCGTSVPALGQGSWYIGDDPRTRSREISAVRQGIAAGMTLLDTAEMYGGGRSEALLGEAIRDIPREKLFLVSKVLPSNAGRRRMESSLDASLKRLGVSFLDLYLYHWIGSIPLAETVECLEEMKAKGKIRNWGVSNFDIDDMEALWELPAGRNCQVNQVLYHLGSRGIEYSLKPWMKAHGVVLMSYCPLAQAGTLRQGLFTSPAVRSVAEKHGCTATQVLLAWNIRDGNTIAIPRSSRPEHTLQNAGADAVMLDEEDLALLDKAYPAPRRKEYLDMQ